MDVEAAKLKIGSLAAQLLRGQIPNNRSYSMQVSQIWEDLAEHFEQVAQEHEKTIALYDQKLVEALDRAKKAEAELERIRPFVACAVCGSTDDVNISRGDARCKKCWDDEYSDTLDLLEEGK